MRTVLTHFYNEEYLLPWWLEHHLRLFDHGVLIDHGSTDASADICRRLAPHWRLVRSRLNDFDTYLTDFELMGYEEQLPGWKIALTVTEFLLPARPLAEFERKLERAGRLGGAATGFVLVDMDPGSLPAEEKPLPLQKHHGIDENIPLTQQERERLGIGVVPGHNRPYHRLPVGMYTPGRHASFHPDNRVLHPDLVVLHFAFAPWNEAFLRRKLQIGVRVPAENLARGWGHHHAQDRAYWDLKHRAMAGMGLDLRLHPVAGPALARLEAAHQPPPLT
jgi:hypothetical protein